MSKLAIGWSAYALGAFLTFGWAANAPCIRLDDKDECADRGTVVFVAFYESLVWPLYWNFYAFKSVRR